MASIDRIDSSEASRFKVIRLRSLKENPEAFASSFEVTNTWNDSQWISQVESLNTYIASVDGNDVGVVRVTKDDVDPDTCWLRSMWVAPEARGKNVASELLRVVIDWGAAALGLEEPEPGPVVVGHEASDPLEPQWSKKSQRAEIYFKSRARDRNTK